MVCAREEINWYDVLARLLFHVWLVSSAPFRCIRCNTSPHLGTHHCPNSYGCAFILMHLVMIKFWPGGLITRHLEGEREGGQTVSFQS